MSVSLLRIALHWQIAIALVLAGIVGSFTSGNETAIGAYAFIGTLFLNALKMLIVPLIVSAIVSGMLGMQRDALGRLGLKTLVFYVVTVFLAVVTGLLVLDLIQPGIIGGEPAGTRLGLDANTDKVVASVSGRGLGDVVGIFERMIPTNLFVAAAEGEMLGLIFFSILFGAIAVRLPDKHLNAQRDFWNSFYEVMIGITHLIIKFAPIGVFGLVAKTVASTGFQALAPLALFFFSVLLALAIHAFVTLPLILKYVAKVPPWSHLRAMSSVMLMAFSTSSSSRTPSA